MRLTELHPVWRRWGPPPEDFLNPSRAIGITFDCPIHGSAAHRVELDFINPFDHQAPVPRKQLFHRCGTSFETLTLTELIDDLCEGVGAEFARYSLTDGIIRLIP